MKHLTQIHLECLQRVDGPSGLYLDSPAARALGRLLLRSVPRTAGRRQAGRQVPALSLASPLRLPPLSNPAAKPRPTPPLRSPSDSTQLEVTSHSAHPLAKLTSSTRSRPPFFHRTSPYLSQCQCQCQCQCQPAQPTAQPRRPPPLSEQIASLMCPPPSLYPAPFRLHLLQLHHDLPPKHRESTTDLRQPPIAVGFSGRFYYASWILAQAKNFITQESRPRSTVNWTAVHDAASGDREPSAVWRDSPQQPPHPLIEPRTTTVIERIVNPARNPSLRPFPNSSRVFLSLLPTRNASR